MTECLLYHQECCISCHVCGAKVFDLINTKIKELEKRYEFGQQVYKGCPMNNVKFGINTLKNLKEELENE